MSIHFGPNFGLFGLRLHAQLSFVDLIIRIIQRSQLSCFLHFSIGLRIRLLPSVIISRGHRYLLLKHVLVEALILISNAIFQI